MGKKHVLLALLMLMAVGVRAQLRSEGPVPEDLRRSVRQLYESDFRRGERYAGKNSVDYERVLQSSFQLSKTMVSGRIVYGDEVTQMVERIADTLLKDYPALRSELHFYTVNSSEANAFATSQGLVFVNLGLVARVENEAQLAFILSHEIVHYLRSHSMEEMVVKKRHDGLRDETSGAMEGDIVGNLDSHNRSRQVEAEADSLGILMFYNHSPYDRNVVNGVFNVLQYGAMPFDNLTFDTTWFNTPDYRLVGCWLPSVGRLVDAARGDAYRLASADFSQRRRSCTALMQGGGRKTHVTMSQADFEALRRRAQVECVRLDIIRGQYPRAIYNASLLRHEKTTSADSATLDRYLAYALYSFALHRFHESPVASIDYSTVEGESRQVYYALQTMTKEQLHRVALHHVLQARRRYPSREEYLLMAQDLMELMPGRHEVDTLVARTNRPAPTALPDSSHLIVFNPSYLVFNNVSDEVSVHKSVDCEQRLVNRLMAYAKRTGKQGVDFSDQGLQRMATDTQYNDFVTLCEWMSDFWLSKGTFKRRLLMQSEMDDLTSRYGAREVNLTSVLNVEHLPGLFAPGTMICLPLIPIVINGVLSGTENTDLYSLTIDAREGKILSSNSYRNGVADHDALIDAMLYDGFLQSQDTTAPKPVGFLGRRLGIEAGASLGLSGIYPMVEGHYFALTPWATVEYALARRWTLFVSGRYHGGYSDVKHVSNHYEWDPVTDSYNSISDTAINSSDLLILSLGTRYFPRNDYAPLGIYLGLGANWTRSRSLEDGDVSHIFGLQVGMGRNYIFHDRLILNYEVQYSYNFGFLSNFIQGYDVNLSNLFTLRLGLGFLPF